VFSLKILEGLLMSNDLEQWIKENTIVINDLLEEAIEVDTVRQFFKQQDVKYKAVLMEVLEKQGFFNKLNMVLEIDNLKKQLKLLEEKHQKEMKDWLEINNTLTWKKLELLVLIENKIKELKKEAENIENILIPETKNLYMEWHLKGTLPEVKKQIEFLQELKKAIE